MLPLILLAVLQPPAGGAADALGAALRERIAQSGAEVALAFRSLDGDAQVLIEPDTPFHAASMMKVPVLIELFAQARAGRLSLADALPIRNEFRSIVDGSAYALSEGDDSDREVYAALGRTMTLEQLAEAMITVSSNFATNLLIETLGAAAVQARMRALGADGMQVLRGVEDTRAFERGLNNTTTARALLTLFEALARGRAVDAASDAAMIEMLKRQQFREALPAGVPAGTPVAHKTGNITRIHHDGGIVYARRPYVLVVLVRGIADKARSAALIADLSGMVYRFSQAGPQP